ncbi:MAG: XRE family transcriptional regulator [Phascolarctobacterium sp.]|nr:XRE family transcriptional regulator [Phascolarctobacterium sp.]
MKKETFNATINPHHVGSSFEDFVNENFSPEEIKLIEAKAKILGEIIDARKELSLTQKRIEELSGIKQPMIAKIENGNANPSLDSLLRILISMGKTLKVVPIQ